VAQRLRGIAEQIGAGFPVAPHATHVKIGLILAGRAGETGEERGAAGNSIVAAGDRNIYLSLFGLHQIL